MSPAGASSSRPAVAPGAQHAQRIVTSAERLRRLLALVPYVFARRVVGLAETAAAFGMTERELIDDLNLAWCVELKDPEPYCPIDLSYEDGEIAISQAEAIARPLRLAADEASALLVALRMLNDATMRRHGDTSESPIAGSGDSADSEPAAGGTVAGEDVAGEDVAGDRADTVIARLIAKIEAAAGGSAAARSQVTIQLQGTGGSRFAPDLTAAVRDRRRVHLRYYVESRDEATERDVDPMRLLVAEGRTYLEGWCRRAEGVRLFRLDRMLAVTLLDAPASVPEEAGSVDVEAGLFRASPSDLRATLELAADARWIAEYYPCESVTELGDGRLSIVLRTPDPGWIRRLALRFGDDARVVAPQSLAAEVRAAAEAALALYD